MKKIYEIYGEDGFSMTTALLEHERLESKIPKGAKVLIKPNLVLALEPKFGATTHPEIVAAVAAYLQKHGAYDIVVAEGSWVGASTEKSLAACGYKEVLKQYNLPFVDLKHDKTVKVKTPYREMDICKTVLEADFVVNVPVLKGHCQTVMTCAIKNLKGCIPDSEKRRFHTEGLHKPIAALGAAIKPQLTIVDSLCGDLNFEEGGTPVLTNRIFLTDDSVLADRYGCELMGIDYREVSYIELAESHGLGSAAFSQDMVEHLNRADDTATYKAARVDHRVGQLIRERSACSACYAAAVRALYKSGSKETVHVGQGYKGVKIDGFGVGNCCAGACVFVPGCPPTAKDIVEKLAGY